MYGGQIGQMKLNLMAAGLLAAALGASAEGQTASPAATDPALVVVVTIDGFRADYLERFGSQLTGGLGRLTKGGAWFTNAHQDHAITETAPGHASILSGRFPRSTGIAANRVGVVDPEAQLLGSSGVVGASPKRFQGSSLFDWMRTRSDKSRALSVSSKDRGAILPVGKAKEHVYWYPGDGSFTTSRYYADSLPAWVTRFNARQLPQSYAGKDWTLIAPASSYREPDSVSIEGAGNDFVFPHPTPPAPQQAANWIRATPFIDEVVIAFALEGINALRLGEGPHADLLAISLSATDAINHRLGPDSREAHDQVLRTDKLLGTFLDSLYRIRDPSRILVVLTADHGFSSIPELAPASANPRPTRTNLDDALAAARAQLTTLKVDTLAIDVDQQIVLLDRSAFQRANVKPDAVIETFIKAARATPGIRRIDKLSDLASAASTDPVARRWSNQFTLGSNVELVATLHPGSLWTSLLVASHGSPYDADSHVPIVFYGAGIKPGRHTQFVRTVDIAPTLARVLRLTPAEKLDGVPLTAALK